MIDDKFQALSDQELAQRAAELARSVPVLLAHGRQILSAARPNYILTQCWDVSTQETYVTGEAIVRLAVEGQELLLALASRLGARCVSSSGGA